MKHRISAAAAILAAAALLMTGCASSSGDSGSAASTPGASGALTKINVAVSPSATTSVPMYLGVNKGFFAEHGLDVTLSVLTNGTVAIPQVVSGQNQFSMASLAPVVAAVAQGLPIKVVGAANIIPTSDSQFQGFVVRSDYTDSTLASAKIIAAQSALVDPVQADSVTKFGGDYSKLTILQTPLTSIADAIKAGSADVGLLQQPFLAQAIAEPGLKLFNYIGPDQSLPGTPGAVFIGAEDYMKANPQIVSSFQAAVLESYAYAQSNQQETANFVPNTGLSTAVPPVNALGAYAATEVTADKYDELLQLYSKYGQNPNNLTSSGILYTP
ncbi:ABC transporter substrate-binding protein [Subtercola lobariae]|nr:ABC transporter substrate-binding protein [Subtercola lobariae]